MTITVIRVALDVVSALVGLVFGGMRKTFRMSIKYFAPVFFLLGYLCFGLSQTLPALLAGCLFIGIANGVGVPYLNTIASIKAGREAATTVMPLLSAALYAGQFLSPLLVTPLAGILFPRNVCGVYLVACIFCVLFLAEVFLTRQSQALPPEA